MISKNYLDYVPGERLSISMMLSLQYKISFCDMESILDVINPIVITHFKYGDRTKVIIPKPQEFSDLKNKVLDIKKESQ